MKSWHRELELEALLDAKKREAGGGHLKVSAGHRQRGKERSTGESCSLGSGEGCGMGGCAAGPCLLSRLAAKQGLPEAGLHCGSASKEFASCWSAPDSENLVPWDEAAAAACWGSRGLACS